MTYRPSPGDEPRTQSDVPIPPPVPREVEALAAERQLGQLWNARIVADPPSIAKVAVIGLPFLVLAAVGLPSENTLLGIIGLLSAVVVIVALVILVYAAKTALAGADDWYLYTNGFVDGRRRRLHAVPWAEVSMVTRARMGNRTSKFGSFITPDTQRGCQVSLRDGSSTFLMAVDALDEGKLLCTQFEHLATQAGVPVMG